jgi:hypothetical protein
MGVLEQAIQSAISAQADRRQIKQILSGTAMNVGETACDVLREDAPVVYGVRLNAIDDELESFVTIYPAEKSRVLIGIVENLKTEAVVLRCSEVEKVKLKVGGQTLLINKDGFIINEGGHGMMKIEEAVNWMSKVYADLQTLKAQLSSWPVAGNGAPLGLTFNPTTGNPSITTFEDKKIKH